MKKLKVLVLAAALMAVAVTVACTASQVQTISQLIGIAVNAVPGVVGLLTTNPQAVNAANTAKADYATAQTLINGYQANSAGATTTAQRISAALADANTNLSLIVAAVPTSAANKQKIDSICAVLIGVGQDIIADLPSSTATATVAHVALPKPNVVQKQISQILAR